MNRFNQDKDKELSEKIGSLIATVLFSVIAIWIFPAILILVWSYLIPNLFGNFGLPENITWVQSFMICVFFWIATGWARLNNAVTRTRN